MDRPWPALPGGKASSSWSWSEFDRAQLPRELAFNQSEFNWFIVQGTGQGDSGPRRLAALFCIHRTGPRLDRLSLRPSVLDRSALPRTLRDVVPSWLPLFSPVRLDVDDRPLFMAVVYDLDHPDRPPLEIEAEVEHSDFDAERFSGVTRGGSLQLLQFDVRDVRDVLPPSIGAFYGTSGVAAAIKARCEDFDVELYLKPVKAPVAYGRRGAPRLRHGPVETHYVQRPRLEVVGHFELGRSSKRETITGFVGDASQDRQWMTVTTPRLKWMWPHLRLSDGRELSGYVLRDSSLGRWARPDEGREIGRNGWLVERDGTLVHLPGFDVRSVREFELKDERGVVPTRFEVTVPELDARFVLEHTFKAPFRRMRAFGRALDAGTWEGPADIVEAAPPITGHCWVEIMNAASTKLDSSFVDSVAP